MTLESSPYDEAAAVCKLRSTPPTEAETAPRKAEPPTLEQLAASRKGSGLGISCSGGGIRSASFCLGALQALARRGRLDQADYLAAVSGGSYIAASYAMVARHSDPDLLADKPPFAPGTPEEAFVRNNCSYLAAGLPGKARFLASVAVGLLANVLFFGLLLYVLRPLGWLYGEWHPGLREAAGAAALSEVRAWAVAAGMIAGAGVGLALWSRVFHPSWRWRRTLDLTGAWAVAIGAAVALVGILLPWLVLLLRELLAGRQTEREATVLGGTTAAGAVAVGVGALAQVTSAIRSAFAVGKKVADQTTRLTKLGNGARTAVLYLVGGLVAPVVLLAGALLVLSGGAAHAPDAAEYGKWAAVMVGLVVFLRFADVTSWSMHPYYRRRLASAFAVKRTKTSNDTVVPREIDYNAPLPLSEFDPAYMAVPFPEILVCAAANVTDPGATPPGSAISSFVFSPTTVGGPLVGGMPTTEYEARVGKRRRRDVTLPAAVAMSGAALSPAMGKMTKAPVRALLALANVRLGVWMPNPGRFSEPVGRWRRLVADNPRPTHLLYEVLGRHKLTNKYVYVTDGGHYENLGLVELLRRQCRTIVCLDAAGGAPDSFVTLGEAIAIARAELTVEIDVNPLETITKKADGDTYVASAVAVGTIHYPDGTPPGTLVYVKSTITTTCPWDVKTYAQKDEEFPAHPTSKQLFTGERFEAYRSLGYDAGKAAADVLDKLFATAPSAPSAPRTPAPVAGDGDA